MWLWVIAVLVTTAMPETTELDQQNQPNTFICWAKHELVFNKYKYYLIPKIGISLPGRLIHYKFYR